MNRRNWISSSAALAAAAWLESTAQAQTWPMRPIRLVVPYPPGGSTDISGRLLGQYLSKELGVPVVVDNIPGVGGVVGSDQVRRAAPDGYSFVLGSSASHSVNMVALKTHPYDPITDFAPVTLVTKYANSLFVAYDSAPKTLADIEEMARKEPGLPYATAGAGSTSFLSGELLRSRAKLNLTAVHYKGISPAMIDVISGVVPMGFGDVVALAPHVASKKARVIAVTSLNRVAALPEVPAMSETYPGFESVAWQALYAPRDTPAPIVARVNAVIANALRQPELKSRIEATGGEIVASSPTDLTKFMEADINKWKALVKELNIQFE